MFFNENTKRVTYIKTESIISNLSGETAGVNDDNLIFTMLVSCQNLIQHKPGANPGVIQTTKEFSELYPKDRTMSPKPTETSSAPIIPRQSINNNGNKTN